MNTFSFKINDEVFFINNNKLYKGIIISEGLGLYYIKSPLGLLWLNEFQMYLTLDALIKAITYEEPVSVNGEFKTWSVD